LICPHRDITESKDEVYSRTTKCEIKQNAARQVIFLRAVMSFDIPTVAEIQLAAERGQRITQDDVSAIAQAESALTGRGPSRGGPAGE
jgi:hypothetical protein